MNPIAAALATALALAVLAAVAGLAAPVRVRAVLVGVLTAALGLSAVVAGALAVTGPVWRAYLPWLLPPAGLELAVDALSGWFLLIIGGVGVVVGGYTVGYAGRRAHGVGSRGSLALLPLFAASMLLVPAAGGVPAFLLAWELMALTSLMLVLTEHRDHDRVRPAAVWYAAMTQCGFVTVLIGLVWLSAATHSTSFVDIRSAAAGLPPMVAGGIFLLCLAGFAAKAGIVPLHPWLPRAHAEAPSHVSALMSAAMVKLGAYGLLRTGFDLFRGGVRWWWLVAAGLGVLSALYGILQAAVATDLKRLLAFSTAENTGLILLGIGFAGLLAASRQPATAAVALAAALLHCVNHAAFKTLLFLSAGSVHRATGLRNLDALGGLSRRMPATTALFALGALAASALPPGNGFVSEWLLLQALLHQSPHAGTTLAVAAPVAAATVALTAGIGLVTYVKALGTGFLARPRSSAAAGAREAPVSMLAAMAAAAGLCTALALVPAFAAPALSRVSATVGLTGPIASDPGQLRLSGISGRVAPLWIAVGLVVLIGALTSLGRLLGRRRRRTVAWDCGDGPLTARMEYTATSYAEPLQRVFDDTLAPERDVDVTHHGESAYHLEAIRFRQHIPDRIENRLYRPLIGLLQTLGETARRLAPGGIHRYLAYMLTALVAVIAAGVLR